MNNIDKRLILRKLAGFLLLPVAAIGFGYFNGIYFYNHENFTIRRIGEWITLITAALLFLWGIILIFTTGKKYKE